MKPGVLPSILQRSKLSTNFNLFFCLKAFSYFVDEEDRQFRTL
jgi:hypothetical protein